MTEEYGPLSDAELELWRRQEYLNENSWIARLLLTVADRDEKLNRERLHHDNEHADCSEWYAAINAALSDRECPTCTRMRLNSCESDGPCPLAQEWFGHLDMCVEQDETERWLRPRQDTAAHARTMCGPHPTGEANGSA
jgi:hypothetical protein